MKTGILAPFTGSKASVKRYPIGVSGYDAIIEPFAGAGHVTTRAVWFGVPYAFVSDADVAVGAVWRSYADYDDMGQRVSDACNRWAKMPPQIAYDWACGVFNERATADIEDLALARILLGRLVFGGVVRVNAQGKLNVALSQDKASKFNRWVHKWPYRGDTVLSVSNDWRDCVEQFVRSSAKSAIAFVDPPYWLPYSPGTKRRGTGAMTPAYPTHGDPSGEATLNLCVDCVAALTQDARVKRIVVTNYYSERLCDELARVMGERYVPPREVGTLQTMNRGQTARDDAGVEALWCFDDVPIVQNAPVALPLAQQLCLI